ncbi:MAG TPA: HAD-IIIC family phosphatase, partial [Gemmatimonadales bacterium]|nr:HAD-IIIC family phosphatase [Gemmatimonadales bacterium]
GLAPAWYVAPFNSWAQEIIGPDTGLRRFQPEIVFLSVALDDLVPGLADGLGGAGLEALGATAVERVLEVARRLAEWSESVLVVHGFHSTHPDPAGALQGRNGPGRSAIVAGLNQRLAEGLREHPRGYLLDFTELLARRGGGGADNPKMRHLAGMRLGDQILAEVARAYARYLSPLKGLTRKCVVLDLDNTLWGGIVGEDGPHGIRLGNTAPGSEYQEFQRYLKTLTDRGILLAVNSKNNPDDALEVIRSHEGMVLRESDFSAVRINWRPKPENMRSIAEELNIGVDSFVFLDDNPDEREMMRQLLPEVLTVDLPTDPARYRATVESLPQLQTLVVTEEDRGRVQQYRANRERERARDGSASLEDYLGSLGIVVEVRRAAGDDLARIHQLFQRTNQFNLTTRRYDLGQVTGFASDPGTVLLTARTRDRFGDHGLVAVALARTGRPAWTIDSFLMSCRVIGYGVESAVLSVVSRLAREAGATELVGELIPTKKNAPARDFYGRHGFEPAGERDEVAL